MNRLTKLQKIIKQKKKIRNKETLYRAKKILENEYNTETRNLLIEVVDEIDKYGQIYHIEKYLRQGYKLVEEEVLENEN